jgi:ribonuclease HI
LGNVSNNIVEAYALWEGVQIAREKRISKIVILGDSMMVAWEIIKISMTGNNVFNSIISHTLTLLAKFEEIKIFHIKREFNSYVDYWAKLRSRLNEGTIIINGVRGFSLSHKSKGLDHKWARKSG